jgi:tetratricopeptide (TPR) repeat protein
MMNKSADAQKRYEAIVATNQRAPVAANNLAWIYAENGANLDVALQLAQNAKSQLVDVPQVNDTLGWVYYKKDLPLLAIPPLEESVAKDPSNGSYRLHLGLAYAKAGQSDKARSALERALQLSPQVEGADVARKTLMALNTR